MKYIIVTGGVISGLGKGITASSIGLLLKSHGLAITAIKIDPYINRDSGTMSPFEHGEAFVLNDGSETDLDLGNYERFLDINLRGDNNLTTGKVYQAVIEKERRGEYLGKTVQIVPHITDYIQEHIQRVAQTPVDKESNIPDVCIIELGGTIGDIESLPFLEALAQLKQDLPSSDYCFVHVSLIPTVNGELKTKPTQHSVKSAKSYGIIPDVLCLRSDRELDQELQTKLRRMCHLPLETAVITNHNVDSIYRVPELFLKQKLDQIILSKLELQEKISPNLDVYYSILAHLDNPTLPVVNIGIVGKYTKMQDTYLSLLRALDHAAFHKKHKLNVVWIDAEEFETNPKSLSRLDSVDGILIPGGFGSRGIEGMILAAQYAREQSVPLLGICLGMQIMLIEIARNVMGWEGANSTEFDPKTLFPIIHKFSKSITNLGGTMRLGLHNCELFGKTKDIYNYESSETISTTMERHRHRYCVKSKLFQRMLEKNAVCIGSYSLDSNSDNNFVEIIEYTQNSIGNKFGIGCQFHAEYLSRNGKPHPLFVGFLNAAINK